MNIVEVLLNCSGLVEFYEGQVFDENGTVWYARINAIGDSHLLQAGNVIDARQEALDYWIAQGHKLITSNWTEGENPVVYLVL